MLKSGIRLESGLRFLFSVYESPISFFFRADFHRFSPFPTPRSPDLPIFMFINLPLICENLRLISLWLRSAVTPW
jgi:hypothetical protein